MKPHSILISGWAHPAESLLPLADHLSSWSVPHLLPPDPLVLRETLETYSGEEKIFLAGWSLGGLLALEAALSSPKGVAGLVLVNATARFCRDKDYPSGTPEAELRALTRAVRRTPAATIAGFLANAAKPYHHEDAEHRDRTQAALALGSDVLLRGLDRLAATDLRNQLPRLHCPLLAVHGREDAVIPWQASEYITHNVPHGKLVLHDHVGHDLPLRAAEHVAEDIASFAGGRP